MDKRRSSGRSAALQPISQQARDLDCGEGTPVLEDGEALSSLWVPKSGKQGTQRVLRKGLLKGWRHEKMSIKTKRPCVLSGGVALGRRSGWRNRRPEF